MPHHAHHLIANSQRGFALISVLALVSLAALTATAFLASARLERQATLPMGNTVRLEWALTSGEKCAEQTISDASEPAEGTAKNFVTTLWRGTNANDWTNETGYLLIGEPNANNSVRWTYYAGFSPSGMTNLSTNFIGSKTKFTNSHQGTFLADCSAFMSSATNGLTPTNDTVCTTIPLLGGLTSPPVGWVYLTQRKRPTGSTNEVTSPVARVAWFIEDLSGKIDAERMGRITNRNTGTNPEEISLANMTRANGTLIFSGATNLMTNAANRKLLFTPGLLANSTISGLTNSDDLRYFATGLREFRPVNNANNNGMLDWIPSGIPVNISGSSTNPYANSGYLKLDLNQLIALPYPNNVRAIDSVISNNLPKFASTRSGGFNSDEYRTALAVNIIDYADTDNQPTFVAGANNVRGVEALPFVNERVTFFNVISTNALTTAATNGLATTIVTQDFYEFWNPANKPTLPVTLSIVASNNLIFDLGSFDAPFAATNSAGQDVQVGLTTNSFAIPSIQPNGFFVTNSLMVTNIFLSPIEFPPAFPLNYSPSQNFFKYKVYLGSVNATNLYDQTLIGCYVSSAGVLPLNLNGSSSSDRRFFGSYSAFAAQTPRGTFRTAVGDPRMMFYLNDNQDQITYGTGSSFGGRNLRSGVNSSSNYFQVSVASWPDGGHNSSAGTNARTSFPSEIPLAAYSNAAPGRISDSGSLTNICELGAIYDPIQWRDPTFQTVSGFGSEPNGGQWTILTTTTNAVSDNQYGGGNSLRIGRSEHSRFAFINFASNSIPVIPNMGGSSAALLDLFCISNGNTNGGRFRTGGKINLNTAPAPVLRALAGGILLTNDPSQSPTNAIVPPGMAEAFAQGVMRFRSQYPFLTPSHLSFIGTDPAWPNTNSWPTNSIFGNTNSIYLVTNSANNLTTTSLGITAWNDQAAEEWFSKIYNLSTVQSDNYRVYIVAQLVATNANGQTNAISPVARKYVQFANRPATATTVGYTNYTTNNVSMYSWAISKGTKKVYESPY